MKFFFLLFLISCSHQPIIGNNPPNELLSDIKNDLYPKIDIFFQNRFDSLKIVQLTTKSEPPILNKYFNNKPVIQRKYAAFCSYKENIIYLSPKSVTLSNSVIQGLVDHEVGHCVFGMAHDYTIQDVGGKVIPASIMNPNVQQYYTNQNIKSYYRNEMIKNPSKFNKMYIISKEN